LITDGEWEGVGKEDVASWPVEDVRAFIGKLRKTTKILGQKIL
jgi:hypothetical protein